MALSKILCIFATTFGLHVSSTSPNPPLHSSERTVAPTRVEFILVSPSFRVLQKIFYWGAAIAETAIIVAQFRPRSVRSQLVIRALTLGGGLPSIRPTPPLVIGCLLVTSGALLRLLCYRSLGRYFTFEAGITRNHRLVTTGPYALVRHPGYAGAVLAYLGLLLHYGPGSWFTECVCKGSTAGAVFCAGYVLATSLVVVGLLSRIAKEDQALKREFGREWDEWAARVPCILIPCVY
ncbi:hypothetical protein DFH08DRAFT_241426 [Mycena albidolilacea]|uniref:Protein-S-isoprenylcysteine O-methyltransferase n=1 Tax=Mycena albidolilacea TaxID=1033008 RepID=A0AAD6ZVU5_9AGAR|nr:hypothetical protein DFH08DRAFT_241426 [Mycena albidolilacea]